MIVPFLDQPRGKTASVSRIHRTAHNEATGGVPDAAVLLVIVQILLDLLALGLVVRAFVS
jgi:hypothetical protein